MPYPIVWLESIFKSRQRTEELFAPEVENGVLSWHDYQLAVDFLPGYHRHYGFLSIVAVMTSTAYGYRKKWPTSRTFGVGTGVYVLGKIVGGLAKLQAHRHFIAGLDDPKGFAQACENTHRRLGGQHPLGFDPQFINTFGEAKKGEPRPESLDKFENESDRERPDWQKVYRDAERSTMTSEPAQPMATSNLEEQPSQATSDIALSAWDSLRKTNASAASNSSWDSIRQGHERTRMAQKQQTTTTTSTNTYNNHRSEDEKQRAIEQANFDALLEAERSNKHTD